MGWVFGVLVIFGIVGAAIAMFSSALDVDLGEEPDNDRTGSWWHGDEDDTDPPQ